MRIKMTIMFIFISCLCVYKSSLSEESVPKTLNMICKKISEEWVGAKYYYKSGGKSFYQKCVSSIKNKDLMSGLWAIRTLVPDGHADFNIKPKNSSQIYPIVLDYNPYSKNIVVVAVLDEQIKKYLGMTVRLINGVNPLEFIAKRAKIEPQSTYQSGLENATRSILFQPSWKPYPDFPGSVVFVFEDGSEITLKPELISKYHKTFPYFINNNGLPSIWANLPLTKKSCKTKSEIAGFIKNKNSNWFWWHPTSMNFDMNNIDKAFECWSKHITNTIDGVILDLRDTAGGGYEQVITVASIFNVSDKMTLNYRTSNRGKASFTVLAPEWTPPHWGGKVIMITNGICGSGCEALARIMNDRKRVCSYGSPTAGRNVGTNAIDIDNNISLDVPVREYLDFNGESMEGKPFIPQHSGYGDVNEAINTCARIFN